jgi:filamentous hemagglutinin family protein
LIEFKADAFNLLGQSMSAEIHSPRLGPPLLAALLAAGPAQAQIVTDGSVGPKVSLSGPQVEIGANLGTQRDANLFHSFEKFGIAAGQTATFTGPGTIRNVISRVTGGEVSTIDGTLASRVGQADLYFLNPAGVVLGPNAQLAVPGSFHVSTAHELRFADGARFSALDKTGSGLTVAPPEAFGFLDRPPGRIAVDQSELRLTPGKTFSLVGGDLLIDGGRTGSVGAADGVVQLVSAAGPGAVRIADAATTVGQRGEVRVTQSEDRSKRVLGAVDVSGRNGGGSIRIRGGRVVVEGAWIFADNYGSRDSTGGVDVRADALLIRDGLMTADTLGSGNAGRVTINADVLELHDGGQIHSITYASGNAGQVTVTVTADRLLVAGVDAAGYGGLISSGTFSGSTGQAGVVAVSARELELRDGGQIGSATWGAGNAGQVTVTADRLLVAYGVIASQANHGSSGAAGTVAVSARELELRDAGQILSNTWGAGNAGQVTVTADRLLVAGSKGRSHSVISGTAQRGSTGQAGTVAVSARELELRDAGQITSITWGAGNAGQVTVTADRLLLVAHGVISSSAQPSSTGRAGTVAVSARELELRDGGQIHTSTLASGNAGQITVTADRLLVAGSKEGALSGIFSSTEPGSTGAGGIVNIQARTILLQDQGAVATESDGTGPAGSLSITAADTLRLDNAAIGARTASAEGGDVTVAVGRLFDLRNSAVTTSVAGGTGSGGNITIDPPLMVLNNSRIQANALQGSGGDITIRAGQLIRTPDSRITASGRVAGNITIAAPDTDVSSSLVVLPGTFLDASSHLRETCAARGGRPTSSLSPGGRGGRPPDPGAPLAGHPFGQRLKQQVATGSPAVSTARPTQAAKAIRVAGAPQPILGAPRPACRG